MKGRKALLLRTDGACRCRPVQLRPRAILEERGKSMDELYAYMKAKQEELYVNGSVSIDAVHFMEMLKTVCYLRQIRYIVTDGERRRRETDA